MVNVALVALGGVIGTALRVGMAELFPRPAHAFPTTTLVVNWSGCLALALLFAMVDGEATSARRWRAFVGTGVLASYTTFSTFALEAARLVDVGRTGVSMVYIVASVAGGILLAVVGLGWGQRLRGSAS